MQHPVPGVDENRLRAAKRLVAQLDGVASGLQIGADGWCNAPFNLQFACVKEGSRRVDGGLDIHAIGCVIGEQGGMAGGLSHMTEAVRQIQGRAGQRQLPKCDLAYANGTGGMLAEQVALILEGA